MFSPINDKIVHSNLLNSRLCLAVSGRQDCREGAGNPLSKARGDIARLVEQYVLFGREISSSEDVDFRAGSSPAEDPERYVNFQTFAAHLHERGMIKGCHLAVWTIQDALDGAKKVSEQERNAYVKATSNWLLLNGEAVYTEIASDGSKSKEWRHWHDRLNEVANGTWNKRPCVYDEGTLLMAGRASVAMDAIELRRTG